METHMYSQCGGKWVCNKMRSTRTDLVMSTDFMNPVGSEVLGLFGLCESRISRRYWLPLHLWSSLRKRVFRVTHTERRLIMTRTDRTKCHCPGWMAAIYWNKKAWQRVSFSATHKAAVLLFLPTTFFAMAVWIVDVDTLQRHCDRYWRKWRCMASDTIATVKDSHPLLVTGDAGKRANISAGYSRRKADALSQAFWSLIAQNT